MRACITLLLIACSATAHGMPASVVNMDASYSSSMDAAVAGLLSVVEMPRSDVVEYAGVVVKCGDEYRYTLGVTANDKKAVAFRVLMPKGCMMAAIYHTHPGDAARNSDFSSTDIETATRYGVGSYILVMSTGQVKLFAPGKTSTYRVPASTSGMGGQVKVSSGDLLPGVLIGKHRYAFAQ